MTDKSGAETTPPWWVWLLVIIVSGIAVTLAIREHFLAFC